MSNMTLWAEALVFLLALSRGHGEGFLSKFTNKGKSGNTQDNDFVNVCETVRIMPRIAMAVVGGAPLKMENSAPYIAAVGERTANGSISWFCGGSLVSPNHILTAAHCLVSRNVSTVRLGSFSTKKRSTENDYEVSETIIHPEYKITQSYNDIGMLRLKDRVTLDSNIKPVCLPQNSDSYEKERAKVIGWGAEEFGGEGTQKLQQVEVEVFSNSNCEKAYSNSTIAPKTFPKGIKNSQLCAGSKKGGKDACQGDSGGPLVLTDEQGIVRQIGIVSTGAGCGFKMYPGVYTRVSSYTDWIKNEISNSGSSQPSQKNPSSREDPNKKNTQPSRPNGASSEPQQQGTLLSTQSIQNSKNNNKKNNNNNHNNNQNNYNSNNNNNNNNYNSNGNNNNNQNNNNNNYNTNNNSHNNNNNNNNNNNYNTNNNNNHNNNYNTNNNHNNKTIGRPHQMEKNSSPRPIQNSREVYSGGSSQGGSSGKENTKISGTNPNAISISNNRKTEHGSREVFSKEKGHVGNGGEHGRGQNSIQTNSQNQHHRVRRADNRTIN